MIFLRLLIALCGLTRIEFLRRKIFRRDPPVCFLTVFEIVFLNACLGEILLPTTSKISGTLCFNSSFPIRFAVGKIKNDVLNVAQHAQCLQLELQNHFFFDDNVQRSEAKTLLDWHNKNPF